MVLTRKVFGLVGILLGFIICCPRLLLAADREYILALVPQMPPVAMHTNWTPLLDRLKKDTGLSITLKLYDKMTDFEQELKLGTADFIFANPPQTVMAHKSQGYLPLIRSSHKLSGIIVVRKDSPIKEIKDLEGKQISFVGSKNL